MDKINELKIQLKMLEAQEKKKQKQKKMEDNNFDYNMKLVNSIIKKRREGNPDYFIRRNEHNRFRDITDCLEKICNMLTIMRKEFILKNESPV
tara:strand:+ start:199 stop:477 length:279 start_codon:yes stop_codon:yes gene_type:complete